MSLDQIVIFCFGATAMVMANDHRPLVRKWAPVLGLVAQPFWLYAATTAHQWGILASSVLYTAAWLYGVYNNFMRKA